MYSHSCCRLVKSSFSKFLQGSKFLCSKTVCRDLKSEYLLPKAVSMELKVLPSSVCGLKGFYLTGRFLNSDSTKQLIIEVERRSKPPLHNEDTKHATLVLMNSLNFDGSSGNTFDKVLVAPQLETAAESNRLKSVLIENGVKIEVKQPPLDHLRDGCHFSGCLLKISSVNAPKRNSAIGVLRICCDGGDENENEIGELLRVVDNENISLLFHSVSNKDILLSDVYTKWFKSTSVHQHSFLDPNFILKQDASIDEELEMMKNVPFPCSVMPVKYGRSVSLLNGYINTSTWPTHTHASSASPPSLLSNSMDVDSSNIMLTRHFSTRNEESYRKVTKEYGENRKNYNAKQKSDILKKREKVKNVHQNSSVNAIGRISLHVLNNGCTASTPSVALNCGGKTFLFNCGEGTQLSILEGFKSLKTLDYILIGSNQYETFAGVAPLLLSSEGWGTSKITAIGAPHFRQYVKGSMFKLVENNADLNVNFEFKDILSEEGRKIQDQVSIEAIPIESNCKDTFKYPTTLCFICHLPERQGSFSIKKAKVFGLKPGPLVGQLKRGQSVTMPDGTVIKPEDVLNPSVQYAPFVIVDIKDETYLDTFADHTSWHDLSMPPSLVIHFTKYPITQYPQYKKFVEMFPDKSAGGSTRHLFLNEEQSVVSSIEGFYHVNYLLNRCCSHVFPLAKGSKVNPWRPSSNDGNKIYTGAWFDLWTPTGEAVEYSGLDLSEAALLRKDPKFYEIFGQSTRVLDYENVFNDELFHQFQVNINCWLENNQEKRVFPRLVCLGTSSAGPSKYRNVSGYYFDLSDETSIVLDCGENSYAQMLRHFGPDQTLQKLTNIRLIFLSHKHADHICGLPLFLSKRLEAFKRLGKEYRSLAVLCPTFLHKQSLLSLQEETAIDLFDSTDLVVLCEETFRGFRDEQTGQAYEHTLKEIGLEYFKCVPVDHRTYKSFGCKFSTLEEKGSGFKVAYSGDTLPCLSLINAASDADLLIHEATHTDDKKYEAVCAKHSTISDALAVHKLSKSKFTLLTHFTHRYSKCIPLDIPDLLACDNVGVAFDHLDITPDRYRLLPKLIDGYRLIFQDHLDKFNISNVYQNFESAPSAKRNSVETNDDGLELKKLKLQTE